MSFPKDQFYRPPEDKPVDTRIVERTSDRVVRLETYPFTKVEATYQVEPNGTIGKSLKRELVALKSNPYYFGYDIYTPRTIEQGGPFTIGRVSTAIDSRRFPLGSVVSPSSIARFLTTK